MIAAVAGVALAFSSVEVRMETTRGPVLIEVIPAWAPRAAERFLALVRAGSYDDSRFFRVVKGRWAQFGISGDPAVSAKWRNATFPDEDVPAVANLRGTVAFAFAVPGGRTAQVFVNLADNRRLDSQGFAPFGRVVHGMENVDALYSGYGEESGGGIRGGRQEPIFQQGNRWLDAHFPKLDRLVRARIVP